MRSGSGVVVRCSGAGAVAGAAGAVARAATTNGLLAVYGWRGWLDLPILVVAGAALGALLGLVVAAIRRRGDAAPRSSGRFVVGTLLAIAGLTAAFAIALEQSDPVALPSRPPPPGPRPPDVVVVIYDAVRADIVTDEKGGIVEWAPRLREFARRSIQFRQAVAPSPWTVPSHASLFSGLSPLDHGAIEESPRIGDDVETLAETLKERGYRTLALVANPWLGISRGFSQGFEHYVEMWRLKDDTPDLPLWFRALGRFERSGWFGVEDPREDKGARLMKQLATDALARLRPDEPLFLFVNLVDAHPPYWAPPPDRLRFVPQALLDKGVDPARVPKHWAAIFAGKEHLSPDDREVLRALNMGEVAYMDRYLGALFDELERRGRFRDAIVAVTSDHGAGLGEDRRLGSGFDLSEEMLRIPLLLHLPGDRDGGTTRDDLVFLHDLHPTILEVVKGAVAGSNDGADEPPPATRHGRSLQSSSPRSAGLAAYSRPSYMIHYLKSAFPGFDAKELDRLLTAVRGARWKLVASSAGSDRLYDLAAGGEREDLAEKDPEQCAQQRKILERIAGGALEEVWRRCLEMALGRPHALDEIDAESLEHLRALGYAVGGK